MEQMMADPKKEPVAGEPATPVAPVEQRQTDRDPKAGFKTERILEGGPSHEIITESGDNSDS
jgi:hypothetical protein